MAGISKVELEAYARLIADAQKEAGRRARRLVSQWMAQHPKATAEEVRNAAIDIVAAVSDEYGNAAASAACDLYDTTMAAEGLDL